jgi:hypothetical protein
MVELPRRSRRIRGMELIIEEQPPIKRHDIVNEDFQGLEIWFEKSILVEVEVVDERPPQIF